MNGQKRLARREKMLAGGKVAVRKKSKKSNYSGISRAAAEERLNAAVVRFTRRRGVFRKETSRKAVVPLGSGSTGRKDLSTYLMFALSALALCASKAKKPPDRCRAFNPKRRVSASARSLRAPEAQ
jgi:hypothetical protein